MFIFDLDHTVIDSSHRQSTLKCGSLDLANWIQNNTPENIARDTLLPLADLWKTLDKKGQMIGVCTARVLQDADYEFLADNGLEYDFILSRPMGDSSKDDDLKERLLNEQGIKPEEITAFFDDNEAVLKRLNELNIEAFDAKIFNKLSGY
jgi:hypothetical protein